MIYKNQAKSIPFNIGVDGLTWTIHVSLDGASYVAASGSTVAAKTGAAGGYVLNAAAADLNADVSEFLLTSSGDTPYVLTITVTTDNEADIRTAVWGSSTVKEVTSLNSNAMSNVARAVWDALTPDHNSIGTMGAFANFLDDIYNKTSPLTFSSGNVHTHIKAIDSGAVSIIRDGVWHAVASNYSELPNCIGYDIYNIRSKTNQLNFSGTDVKATLDGEKVGLSAGQVVASVTKPVTTTSDTDIDTILANTNRIPTSPAAVGSAMTLADNAITAAKIAADAVTEIQAGLATADSVSGLNDLSQAQVQSAAAAALTAYDPPTRAEATADKDAVLASMPASYTPAEIARAVWISPGAVNLTPEAVTDVQTGLTKPSDLVNLATGADADAIKNDTSYIRAALDGSSSTESTYVYTALDNMGRPVAGATVRVSTDRAGEEPIAPDQISDALAQTSWELLPGTTYYVIRTKDGASFNNPDIWKIEP